MDGSISITNNLSSDKYNHLNPEKKHHLHPLADNSEYKHQIVSTEVGKVTNKIINPLESSSN